MPEANASPGKRRSRAEDEPAGSSEHDQRGARKRRAFLHTMGQQLREFGQNATSPQDNGRTSFGTSPTSHRRAPSCAGTVATGLTNPQNVDTPESDGAPGEDDQVPLGAAKSASKWLWRLGEVVPDPVGSSNQALPYEDILDWSQSYFDLWHPAYPFLHAPTVIDYFRQVGSYGINGLEPTNQNILQRIVLRSIMSISIADRRQTGTKLKAVPAALVFSSFNDAINSVSMILTEESSIMSLQALVSIQLWLISMHRYNAASRLEGLALRIVFQLGLHRCPNSLASIPAREIELRKRLFWSMYCIDRQICIRLGIPLGVRTDEMDVCFPQDESHREHEEESDAQDDRLTLLEFLARHASTRGSIMENRNRSAMGINYNESDRVMEVEAEHTKWWNMVDEYLSDDEGAQNILKAHQVTLIVVRFESILALHRSILATSKKDSAYNVALQRCVFASRSIVNTLHRAIKGFGAFDGSPGQHGYERTALVWPSFTWAIWMSVFTIVFAATENQVAKDTAMKLADRSLEVLEHLARRGTNWPEACSVAINNLTSKLREASSRGSTARPGIFPDIAGSRANSATTRMDESGRQNSFRLQSHHQIRSADQQNNHVRTARTPVIPALSNDPVLSLNSRGQTRGLITDFSHPFVPDVNAINAINPAANYLAGAGNFLGIAQQSSDNPLPNDEIMHLFNGEDMAHWFGGETNLGNMMPFDRGLPFGHEC